MKVEMDVNGQPVAVEVDARTTLADALRDHAGLVGTKLGCEHGVCGACTVLLDGQAVRSCLLFAVQADGARVETVEGLSRDGELNALQQAFTDHHALQCGFCTAGFLMSMTEYIRDGGSADEAEVREALSGNTCRCTGYQNIVAAVTDAIGAERGTAGAAEEER